MSTVSFFRSLLLGLLTHLIVSCSPFIKSQSNSQVSGHLGVTPFLGEPQHAAEAPPPNPPMKPVDPKISTFQRHIILEPGQSIKLCIQGQWSADGQNYVNAYGGGSHQNELISFPYFPGYQIRRMALVYMITRWNASSGDIINRVPYVARQIGESADLICLDEPLYARPGERLTVDFIAADIPVTAETYAQHRLPDQTKLSVTTNVDQVRPVLGDDSNPVISLKEFHRKLALRWAPIHYQDVDQSGSDALNGESDYITKIDYDDDWNARNNWENLENYNAPGVTYFSVSSTKTHWYIIYGFFHPRDWCDLEVFGANICGDIDAHENDMEGILAIVRRPSQFSPLNYGQLQGIVTVFHHHFYSATPQGGVACSGLPRSPLSRGQETIDAALSCRDHEGTIRYITAQEAKGHGLRAWPKVTINDDGGIIYYPSSEQAEVPENINDHDVKYQLIDIFEPGGLWDHRNDGQTFSSSGVIAGDNGNENAAHVPWSWDDANDGDQLTGGEMAMDPAKLSRIYFNGETFDDNYLLNPYREIERPDPAFIRWLNGQ